MSGASRATTTLRASWPTLAAFVVVVLGVGIVIGLLAEPGAWYAGLEKPPFNPPSWVFPVAWTVLYIMIAVAGWRVWSQTRQSSAMALWAAQMLLNWLWSPIFFGAHLMWLGLAVIVALLASILGFILRAWGVDRLAAWLFVPYALWVAFATLLNLSLAILN